MIPKDHKFGTDERCTCAWCTQRQLERHVRVARGAVLLDEIAPGWWRRVRVDDLDMGNRDGRHLIVQVLGTPEITNQYDAVCVLLGWNSFEKRRMHAHGFENNSCMEATQELTMAWVEVVLRRHVESIEA